MKEELLELSKTWIDLKQEKKAFNAEMNERIKEVEKAIEKLVAGKK